MLPDDGLGPNNPIVRSAKYWAVAFEFIGSVFGGIVGGIALDRWLGTGGWLALAMIIAGTVIGFYRMVQILQRYERNES
ncbi:MAG TPA: AtpZ/AtpI family protein [Candidatus Binatia bacterium]